jgi:exodeoxyribonuclease VII small subunit
MNNAEENVEKLTFEQAYRQLEETVQKLEAGNLPLAEAVSLYEQGMALAKQCGLQLDEAELTIKQLMPTEELVDFEEPEF